MYIFRADHFMLLINRYINDNLNCIIRVLLDYMTDGIEPSDFLPFNTFLIKDDEWVNMVYTLFDITQSDAMRDYIKPKYEYLLYYVLRWWEETNDIDALIPYSIDKDLIDQIHRDLHDSEEISQLIESLMNYQKYYDFCFYDHDFLTEELSCNKLIYLNNRPLFEKFCDIDLLEYKDIMPKDLREL